ncbi:MAG: hypothetical protein M3R08_01190 [Bacteroidota bacterium]|nr:hypothetical protein [Bacteroidota bacterium]
MDRKKEGELLPLMLDHGFMALITFDKNIQYQQNFKKFTIPVLLLNAPSHSYHALTHLIPKIREILKEDLEPGCIEVK